YFQAEDGIRDRNVTGVQTCALPISLQRVDSEDADVRILLAAPDTVDELCAPLRTNGYVSCAQGNRAIINQNRWVGGVDHFDDDRSEERRVGKECRSRWARKR